MTAPQTLCLPASSRVGLDRAEEILRATHSVALPTETVYGLACDATSAPAVAQVYAIKGRPSFNPLIAHIDSLERAQSLIHFNDLSLKLADAFWPGPLTLVAPSTTVSPVCDLVTAGLDTLAVRWPRSKAMTDLVARLDRPLAAPSANPSGGVSPTTARHVLDGLSGQIELVLDDGPCPIGLESTIVKIEDDQVSMLRPGGITRDQIEACLDQRVQDMNCAPNTPQSPGQLTSHYAPSAKVRLNVTTPHRDEGYLAFGALPEMDCKAVFNLSSTGDLVEAASRLFSGLRTLDQAVQTIAIAPIPAKGLGEAINDRLGRAAADKD